MRFYVASKFENREAVKAFMDELRRLGHTIVGDWTRHTLEGVTDPVHRAALLVAFAEEDRHGVEDCDVLVLLHKDDCRGAFWEGGIAMGAGKRIFVIGGQYAAPDRGPIFYCCPSVHHYDTTKAFLDALPSLASEEWVCMQIWKAA